MSIALRLVGTGDCGLNAKLMTENGEEIKNIELIEIEPFRPGKDTISVKITLTAESIDIPLHRKT